MPPVSRQADCQARALGALRHVPDICDLAARHARLYLQECESIAPDPAAAQLSRRMYSFWHIAYMLPNSGRAGAEDTGH
jgi:hypothetical protein